MLSRAKKVTFSLYCTELPMYWAVSFSQILLLWLLNHIISAHLHWPHKVISRSGMSVKSGDRLHIQHQIAVWHQCRFPIRRLASLGTQACVWSPCQISHLIRQMPSAHDMSPIPQYTGVVRGHQGVPESTAQQGVVVWKWWLHYFSAFFSSESRRYIGTDTLSCTVSEIRCHDVMINWSSVTFLGDQGTPHRHRWILPLATSDIGHKSRIGRSPLIISLTLDTVEWPL